MALEIWYHIRIRLQKKRIDITAAAALHGGSSIHWPKKYTTINFGYRRTDSTTNLLWFGRIGIVQSERMINAHMICTQKQMKGIRGMRV